MDSGVLSGTYGQRQWVLTVTIYRVTLQGYKFLLHGLKAIWGMTVFGGRRQPW